MLIRLLFCLAVIATFTPILSGQTSSRDMKKEEAIWAQLKQVAPDQVENFKAGTVAMDAEKYDEAIRLYEMVMLKAPKFDPAVRRLGLSLTMSGKIEDGLGLLEHALNLNRSPENLSALAQSLAYPTGDKQGTAEQKRRAFELVKEASRRPETQNDSYYPTLLAQLALDLDQLEEFRQATNILAAKHQDLMLTHYYGAILAAYDEHWLKAEEEILKAQSMGLPSEATEAFLNSGVRTHARVWHYAIYASILVGIWIVGLLLLFLVGKAMSRVTLRSIETDDPNAPVSESQNTLRSWYRRLINVGGLYYVISIPIVMFLVLAVAGSLTYAFFMLGRIPIKIVLILVVGALVTVYKMVRTLFIKIQQEDPGRALQVAEAPKLWELTQNVARVVQTRPIDEIRITPGTELAVYEKGTFRERSNDKAKRILILGVGALNGFRLNSFRAVLAHEYGHFSNRDTAGGDVALRVNEHMMRFAEAMYLSGQAVWWNVAFQFLRIYHFIFRRISHGATRLQEVLADRVAALRYGAEAFEDGLTHVVRKSAEFNVLALREINESADKRRALQNLYELTGAENPDIVEAANEALNRKTSEDDTHPSPSDRFRFTRRIATQSETPVTGMVWDLFANREALTLEMTAMIQEQMHQY